MKRFLTLALLAASAAGSQATVYTFSTIDKGFYNNIGGHTPSFLNTFTGDTIGRDNRSFFAFDLSSLPAGEIIVSLSFRYDTRAVNNGPVEFLLSDVSTDYASLVAGTGGVAAFDDLGSGSAYGSQSLLTNEDNVIKTIPLSASAVADAAAAGSSPFVLGGAVLDRAPERFLLGGSGESSVSELEVTTAPVPEPASMAVLGLCLAALKCRRKV